MTTRRLTLRSASLFFVAVISVCVAWTQPFPAGAQSGPSSAETIVVDLNAPSHAFPHFWEKMFGSGRAILSLRESYRHDLSEAKRITGFEYVRFHAGRSLRGGRKWQAHPQFFLCGPDLRRLARKPRAPICRAELHAAQAGL